MSNRCAVMMGDRSLKSFTSALMNRKFGGGGVGSLATLPVMRLSTTTTSLCGDAARRHARDPPTLPAPPVIRILWRAIGINAVLCEGGMKQRAKGTRRTVCGIYQMPKAIRIGGSADPSTFGVLLEGHRSPRGTQE